MVDMDSADFYSNALMKQHMKWPHEPAQPC